MTSQLASDDGLTEEPPASIDFTVTYYISGPMAGYIDNNFPAFEEAATGLRNSGFSIISPHEIKHNMTDDYSWADFIKNDVRVMLKECNGIILLKGWPQSKGSRVELELALSLQWPVYFFTNNVLCNMNMY